MRGGSKPGERRGGRQRGTPNKRTKARQQRIEQAAAVLESLLPDAFKGDAHTFLMAVYKDPRNPTKDRLAAATAAIGYEKAKLAAVAHTGRVTLTHEQMLDELERRANGSESDEAPPLTPPILYIGPPTPH